MKQTYDEEADVRMTAAIRVMALFFVGIMIIAATTSPIATGTKEGERAPALEGKFYNGSQWTDFDLESFPLGALSPILNTSLSGKLNTNGDFQGPLSSLNS